MAFNLGQRLSTKRIPTILGLLVLIGGVVAGVVLVGQQTGFSLRAGPTATPREVRITNISDTSFTVSWVTDTSVSGFVRYGTSSNDLNRNFGDDRDQISGTTGLFTTHYVTVKGLQPDTPYFFKIGTGSQQYDDEGQPWQVTTAPALARPAADPMSGVVLLASGQPASGVIVYVDVEGGSPLSAQTRSSGVFNLSLSQMRTSDLSSFLTYDPETVSISIFAQGADLGSATAVVSGANKNPVPDITLGQNLDFQSTQALVLSPPVITIQANTYVPNELTVAAGQVVTVINNDTASHSATERNNLFTSGVIAPNTQGAFTAPSQTGSYTFFDELFPELESLVGTLIVVPAQDSGEEEVVTALPTPPVDGFETLGESPDATHSVKLATEDIKSGLVATQSPEIKLQGPPGTTIKITVNSEHQQVIQSAIDANGEFEWTPPEDLEPGEHTVTIEYVDENGITQSYTQTFTVLAQAPTPAPTLLAQATPTFSATPTATLTPTASPTARTSMPSTVSGIPDAGILTPTLILLVLGLGLFLAGIGWQVKLMPEKTL
jgi:plastocyanin